MYDANNVLHFFAHVGQCVNPPRSVSRAVCDFNGLMVSYECLPKCCALHRVSMQTGHKINTSHQPSKICKLLVDLFHSPVEKITTVICGVAGKIWTFNSCLAGGQKRSFCALCIVHCESTFISLLTWICYPNDRCATALARHDGSLKGNWLPQMCLHRLAAGCIDWLRDQALLDCRL